jgi:hypothetical protein
MKANRLRAPKGWLVLAAILLGAVLSVSHLVLASPGLIPPSYGRTAYVDFSEFPSSSPAEAGLEGWYADGWDRGSGALQLVRAGAYLEAVFVVPSDASAAELTLTHRSGLAPGCPGGGSAPVTLSVNGSVLAANLAPPAVDAWGFSTNRWLVADRLSPGRNSIRVVAGDLCSVYEIQRLELRLTVGAVGAIEICQMTHAIAEDRPVDSATAFAPSDMRAVCWTQLAPEAIGRRIEFRFYDPSGELYFRTERTADRYNWGYIRIAGWGAANRLGRWRVDVYLAGAFQLSHPFTIGAVGIGGRPQILGIDFPSRMSANGERTYGWVTFRDPDGDISWVTFEAVDGFFSDFEFDPDVGAQTESRFRFYVYTYLRQSVRLRVTLYDRYGHASEPYYLTFHAT